MPSIKLSVVVIAYNMHREIPRTVQSLSQQMQTGMREQDYEIIVVDNGSKEPLVLPGCPANVRVVAMEQPTPSPAKAVNYGISLARGDVIGIMIDGARMASPGLLAGTLHSFAIFPRAVVSVMGFHIGPDIQSESSKRGYNQAQEDRLLEQIRWHEDGYRLFDISVMAGSSSRGLFAPTSETNALFLSRAMWQELGGFDERFASAGGGLVNLDTYARACALPSAQLVVLLGEGTFHQIHGGIASNAKESPWTRFHNEYIQIRGREFQRPTNQAYYLGPASPHALPIIEASARLARTGPPQESLLDRIKRRIKA